MKKLPIIICAVMAIFSLMATSCLKTSIEDAFKDWRESNDEWFNQQKANTAFYTTVTAPWDANAQVLIHWFNDTMLTCNNLRPLFTSTVWVKYRGTDMNSVPFDSSYLRTSPADSVAAFKLSTSTLVEGWPVALTRMHVGDSCRVVIPYKLGYGSYAISDVIIPYTNLVFDIKLVDIYSYEKK